MKMGWTGLESAGKSQLMAVHAWKIYRRNKKWIKKRKKLGLPHVPRTMAFDSPMSDYFVKTIEKAGLKYIHFYNLDEITRLSNIDIFINEILKFYPQRGNEPLDRVQAEFLSQGAKDGIDIYFCSQDFSQAHKQFRFLVNRLYYVVKVVGSRRPTASSPPVRRIWGLVVYWDIKPSTFKGDNATMKTTWWLPNFYFLNKGDASLYDTSYKVKGTEMPVRIMVPQKIRYIDHMGKVVKEKDDWVKK